MAILDTDRHKVKKLIVYIGVVGNIYNSREQATKENDFKTTWGYAFLLISSNFLAFCLACRHARMHTCTYHVHIARTYTRHAWTYTHTHTHMSMCTHARIHVRMYMSKRTYVRTYVHTCMWAHTHTHITSCIHAHITCVRAVRLCAEVSFSGAYFQTGNHNYHPTNRPKYLE